MIPPFHREIASLRQREVAARAELRRASGRPRRTTPRRPAPRPER